MWKFWKKLTKRRVSNCFQLFVTSLHNCLLKRFVISQPNIPKKRTNTLNQQFPPSIFFKTLVFLVGLRKNFWENYWCRFFPFSSFSLLLGSTFPPVPNYVRSCTGRLGLKNCSLQFFWLHFSTLFQLFSKTGRTIGLKTLLNTEIMPTRLSSSPDPHSRLCFIVRFIRL